MKSRTLDSLFENFESFEKLKGMLLLFDKNSEYYKFSGFVTAALLDYEDKDKQISILAINTSTNWFTFKYSREDLKKMLSNCIEFVGNNEDDSFVLEKQIKIYGQIENSTKFQ